MAETLTVIWIAVIAVLVVVAVLFLLGALSVERASPEGDKGCICKQTRFTVYADINCPIHGERR